MKPVEEDLNLNNRIKFKAKAVFVSLGLDTRKLRFDVSAMQITVHGPFKPRRADLSKEDKLKLVMTLEEELRKIPRIRGVRLNLKGAKKRDGRWNVL